MKTINDYSDEQISAVLKKHGAFFAFSKSQFNSQRDPNIPSSDYCRTPQGMMVPKANAKECVDEMLAVYDAAKDQRLKDYGRNAIVKYELNNHECFYTGDPSDAFDSLSLYDISEEEVIKVFRGGSIDESEEFEAKQAAESESEVKSNANN